MHITSIDLNLLVVADSLYRNSNVSKAAKELGLSQSAVSHALGRLRSQLGDSMFVRTSKGIAPTEFARNIQAELQDIIGRAERLVSKRTHFDPREAKGRITLATTDYFETVVMTELQPILAKEAPHLQISIRPTLGELPKRELEEGKFDLAIAGFYVNLPEGFYQSKLFHDGFECATRLNHPIATAKKMSVDNFFALSHALITLQGDFLDSLVRKKEYKRYSRNFVYGSYSFTSLAWILQNSDLVLTAPSLLLKRYQQFFPIHVSACPIEINPIKIRMIWHAQTNDNPLSIWFRNKLKEACSKIKTA